MPSLNIKNEETYRMVHDLAALKGISLVAAVKEAVQEKLDREKAEQDRPNSRKGMGDRLRAIAEKTAPMMQGTLSSTEIFDSLYDEMGLPK
jgi:hypothetical protein